MRIKHKNIVVRGRVQGVFFRVSCKRKAEALGVAGHVRNQSDGSVFVAAEGSEKALEALLAWLHEGPPAASVTAVEAESGEVQGYSGFVISP